MNKAADKLEFKFERTICALPLDRVRPEMSPRACEAQCGAPSPTKAGTR